MKDLSREIKAIKTYNEFGLLDFSEHAETRMRERGISKESVIECISKRDTSIVQYHDINTYHQNKDELYVLHGKFIYKGKSKPLHIICAKEQSENGGMAYSVITVYIPNNNIFSAYGRKLRRG